MIGYLEGDGDGGYDHKVDNEVDFEGELEAVVVPEVVANCPEVGFEANPVVGLLHKRDRFVHGGLLMLFRGVPVVVLIAEISISLVLVVDSVKIDAHIPQILYFDILLHIEVGQFDSFHVGEERQLAIRGHVVILVLEHVL